MRTKVPLLLDTRALLAQQVDTNILYNAAILIYIG